MKTMEKFIGVIIVIILLPFAFSGITSARTQDYNQTNPFVNTPANVTNSTVTLYKDLWEDDLAYINTVYSSNTNDTPAASEYNPASNLLTVDGLEQSASRTLTVNYKYARYSDGTDTFLARIPLFLLAALILAVGFLVWQSRR